ncbi:MAG: DUF1015 domain-containing protein [Tyzzerella sp.]|nr:DUF1015 domain-containing protein [Tyzzerella sp.]
MNIFQSTNILIPQAESMEKWSVIACDQYTSQPEYWERVRKYTEGAVSSLNLILPEAQMDNANILIDKINENMKAYMANGIFKEYKNAYIYVERTLVNGTIRKGVIGAVDLETYDYSNDSTSAIRATERTIAERIPPRMAIRRNASLELPHILMLCDDEKHMLIESLEHIKELCPKLYDFDLMENGGHIAGWLAEDQHAALFDKKLDEYALANAEKYQKIGRKPMVFAVGDGNHSLATAKACYEELKKNHPDKDLSNHPARYALVELENLHDESQQFEPIHRIVTDIDANVLLNVMKETICAKDGYPIVCYIGQKEETVYLDRNLGELPVAILQKFLDEYLEKIFGKIDYIHGNDVVKELASKDNAIGFLLPNIEKNQFFKGIVMDGVLPRKTFSMGHAQEKRYYLEARKIV